jgi:small ligand-binding sensory domain FIST
MVRLVMTPAAQSFSLRAESPARVARAALDGIGSIERRAGALVFLSGSLGSRILEVADFFRRSPPGAPVLIVAGAGVLTERGEIEGESAASGIVWSGGEADAFNLDEVDTDSIGASLGRVLLERTRSSAATALVFAEPKRFGSQVALASVEGLPNISVFGGGGTVDLPVVTLSKTGQVSHGPLGVMLLRGPYRSIVRASPACRLLMPLRTITELQGGLVLSLEGEPALDVLKTAAADLAHQPLVLVALSDAPPSEDSRPELLIRSVQGVDPNRRGVLVSDDVRLGMRLAFAVRDPGASRADFESSIRELSREIAGSAPRFGVFVSCAGRGRGLYGSPDVDVRLLRARFPELPFAGLHSSFELAPSGGRPSLQLYTGVVGLFAAPS